MSSSIKPGTPGWNVKDVAVQPANNVRARVNLKTDKFDDLVSSQGVRVKVYRSVYCSNVKSLDGAEHELNCPLCLGEGFIDRYPIDTMAFIQNQILEKGIFTEGLYDGNAVGATFMQGIELQYFTLVELTDFTEPFYERKRRQVSKVDILRYPGIRTNLVIDKMGKEYFEGSDFTLDFNGNISWCDNKGPESGTIYSVHYDTSVRFRAIKAMHANRFSQVSQQGKTEFVKMNSQWLLNKVFLVTRTDIYGREMESEKIRDSDDAEALADQELLDEENSPYK